MTTISAKTILRSRNAAKPDKVLSTLLLRYPRFIHAELLTHRAFSRNAASSRAIPVKKMIYDILADTAMPIFWGKNQKGMQASEECDTDVYAGFPTLANSYEYQYMPASEAWLTARDRALDIARGFDVAGYHKQVVNRLLEPFLHITVLVSATEWSNFLELRDHEDAEPHIRMLAQEIRACLDDESTVDELNPGEWHLPFVGVHRETQAGKPSLKEMIKLSVARCASTSFKTVDGFDMTLERAIEVHDKLVGSRPIHASPCEHVAKVDPYDKEIGAWCNQDEHGNFIGFRQYRHMLSPTI